MLKTNRAGTLWAGAIALIGALMSLQSKAGERSAHRNAVPDSVQREVKAVELEIDRIETEALDKSRTTSLDHYQQITLLGKLIFYGAQLSVNRNEACSFCHMPETGFAGSVSGLNETTVSYPGSVRTRFSVRRPQSHMYASYSPVLHYKQGIGRFCRRPILGYASHGPAPGQFAAEQAQCPPLNPVEMGLIDPACMVYRISRERYRAMAERLWGPQAFAVHLPSNTNEVCNRPGPASASDPLPLHLGAVDRGIVQTTFDRIAEAIAAFEASPEVNPFSSNT